MTTKPLGQVLYEECLPCYSKTITWDALPHESKASFEREAQAVAAVVREKVAAWVEPQRDFIPATGAEFAAAIRSMKI